MNKIKPIVNKCNIHQCKKILTLFFVIVLINSFTVVENVYPKSKKKEKEKVIVSAVTEKFSINIFGFTLKDSIPYKKEKNAYTLNDKRIIWSAYIRDGVGNYNKEDYEVYWYSPDGTIYMKQTPEFIFIDCDGLKAQMDFNENFMKDKFGVWKLEVIYDNQLIDEKYFYIGKKHYVITEEERNMLNLSLVRDRDVAKDKEEANNITKRRKLEKILFDDIDKKADNVVAVAIKTSKNDYQPIIGKKGEIFINENNEKLYLVYKFRAFFGAINRDAKLYLISPDERIYFEKNYYLIINDEVSYLIKTKEGKNFQLGEWKPILFLKDSKINETHFWVISETDYNSKLKEYRERKKEEEEAQKVAAAKKIHPAQRGGKPTTYWDVRKGEKLEDTVKKWGEPDRKVEIDENEVVWIYWTPGANSSGSGARASQIAMQGNLIGALIYSAIVHSVDSLFAYGKIVVVYFVNNVVEEVGCKSGIEYAGLKDIDLRKLRYIIKDLPE